MHICATKSALAAPISLVAGAADSKHAVPMLGMVLLKASAGKLSMLCSDTAVVARAQTDCMVGKEGAIAVDVRRLGDLLRAVPDGAALDLSVEDKGTLLVKAGRSRFRLPTRPADEFPRLTPPKEERIAVNIAASRLTEMFDQTADSMAVADIRHFLNGALLSLQDGYLYFVSTDGFRLTVAREAIPGSESFPKKSVILPRKTALLARRLVGQAGHVKVTIGESDVQFAMPDGSILHGKAVDGKFPDWERVIPTSTHTVAVDTGRLRDELAMLDATLESQKNGAARGLHVSCAEGVMTLAHADESRCEIDVDGSAGGMDTSFNIDYLRNAADTIGATGEKLRLGFTTGQNIVVVRPAGAEYPLAVVMGMRA
jgi:DNA polymerase-3 subunit beta